MSPNNLEDKLNNAEAAAFRWFSERKHFELTFFLVSFLGLAYYLISNELNFRYPFLYFSNFIFSFKTILFICFLSLGILYEENAQRRFYWMIIVFFSSAFLGYYFSHWYEKSHDIKTAFLVLAQSLLGFCAWSLWLKYRKVFLIWGYAIINVILLVLSFNFLQGVGWFYYGQPILFCAFIIAMMLESVDVSNAKKIALICNPAHLFLSVNYPIDTYLKEVNNDKKVWASGLVHIIKALFTLYVTCITYKLMSSGGFFWSSFKDYLMYLMTVITVGNTVTGISRLFLINVPICSNYAFLSRSPLDFMKRENAHAYAFSLRFFYFNFLKFTKNPLIIVLGYFLVFPFYRNVLIYFTHDEAYSLNNFLVFLWWGYFFWILLLLSIVLFPSRQLQKIKANDWWHVLLNNVFMYLVFLIFRYVRTIYN